MSYQALYRKYRPTDLDSLVGQEHITTTLKNAITTGKISHGYLFTGPRGTGKTSSAKIIARALNCLSPVNGSPCGECESCKLGDNHPDIIEIDAASNNGVDEIRDIRDKVRYTPSIGRFKIYIIDEVHMMTEAANNAFLKTLEEPPEHAIFILATTDAHKVLPTVKSRCQRYDFRRIATPTLIERMEYVVKQEEATISSEAIEMIARLSQGGMRDALSLLDQVLAYSPSGVTIDDVTEVTGGVSLEHLSVMISGLYMCDTKTLIEKANTLIDLGKDPSLLVDDLTLFYRDLLLLKTIGIGVELSRVIVDNEVEQLYKQLPLDHINEMVSELTKVKGNLKVASNPKATLEIAFVTMSLPKKTLPTASIQDSELVRMKEELAELRKMIVEGRPVVETPNTEALENQQTSEVESIEEATSFDTNGDFLSQLQEDLASTPMPDYVEVRKSKVEMDSDQPNETTVETRVPGDTNTSLPVEAEPESKQGEIVDVSPSNQEEIEELVTRMKQGNKERRSKLTTSKELVESAVKEAKVTAYAIFKESEVALVTSDEVVLVYPTPSKVKVANRVANASFIQGALEDFFNEKVRIRNVDKKTWKLALSEFKTISS